MAWAWFLRVLLNSSSFSEILRSISCLTWPSSREALSTLFSSDSREPSASSRADCSSSFSVSMPDLAELQGGPQHLVLLRLEGALRLLKSRLQLLLLGLHAPPLFVQLMDGTSTVSQLVKQILDLIGKVLVLAADNVQLLVGLIQARLEAEPLIAVVASLRVTGIKLGHQVISLGLPFSNNLVKVLTALLSNASSGVGTLVLHGKLLELRIHTRLGLLSRSNLRIERLNQLLSLSDPSAKLGLAALKLINATKSLSLVLGLPQLDLRLGLGEGLEDIILLLRLLINLHPQVLGLTAERFELGEEGGTVAGLAISQPLGVLKLGRQRDLVLLQSTNGVLGLVNLAGQVLSLNLELLLGRVSVIESAGKLILLLVRLNNQALGHLAVLLHVGTVAHGLLESSPGLLEVPLHTGLVLLRLGLVLVDGINLVAQLSHAVVVLLAESSKSSLMSNVSLIQISLQLNQLTLTLLVQLNLGAGVGANLSKPGAKILQVPGKQGAVLLSLGAVVALNRQLLIKLVNAGNKLLDLLGVLGSEGSLVLNLGSNGGNLLVLALHSLGELRVNTLQV